MRDELLSPSGDDDERGEEERDEHGLRPQSLDDFVGQEQLKGHLRVMMTAARNREQPIGHMLFAGPPGLGKTTLAGIIANEMGATMHVTSGPALEKGGDLAAILTKLEDGDVLFIGRKSNGGEVLCEILELREQSSRSEIPDRDLWGKI